LALAVVALVTSGIAPARSPDKTWRIGACHVGLDHVPPSLEPLRSALNELGYADGKNLRLDFRNLADEAEALAVNRAFARERVDLIVAFENDCIRAAKAATAEIPVVFLHGNDPVTSGFVANLAHPGGNLTGVTTFMVDQAKQIELFTEIVPGLKRLLVLYDPHGPLDMQLLPEVRQAAIALKLQLNEQTASTEADVERVFAALRPEDVDGLYFGLSDLRTRHPASIIRLAVARKLPVAAHRREWLAAGALFSYAPDVAADGRVAAPMIDRIFKGAKPSDLPVVQPTKFQLVINLNAAKDLGVAVPRSLLVRADDVIEQDTGPAVDQIGTGDHPQDHYGSSKP